MLLCMKFKGQQNWGGGSNRPMQQTARNTNMKYIIGTHKTIEFVDSLNLYYRISATNNRYAIPNHRIATSHHGYGTSLIGCPLIGVNRKKLCNIFSLPLHDPPHNKHVLKPNLLSIKGKGVEQNASK